MALAEKPGQDAEQRIIAVLEWLSQGRPVKAIVHDCAQLWKIEERQAKEYIAHARRRLKVADHKDLERHRKRHAAMRLALIIRALSQDELATALKAMDSEARLLGLFLEAEHDPDRIDPQTLARKILGYLGGGGECGKPAD